MWLELVNLVTLMETLATWNRTRIGKDIDSAVTLCTIWVLPPVFTWRKGEGGGGGGLGPAPWILDLEIVVRTRVSP